MVLPENSFDPQMKPCYTLARPFTYSAYIQPDWWNHGHATTDLGALAYDTSVDDAARASTRKADAPC